MARFIVSMPDAMLRELDALARREQRNRSELLREAVRHKLAATMVAEAVPAYGKTSQTAASKKGTRPRHARARLLQLGIGQQGCPCLDRLIGPIKEQVNMRKVVAIGKKITGLSKEIIDNRDDRL